MGGGRRAPRRASSFKQEACPSTASSLPSDFPSDVPGGAARGNQAGGRVFQRNSQNSAPLQTRYAAMARRLAMRVTA